MSKTGGLGVPRTPEGKGEGMLFLKAFIKVLDCIPEAIGQVAAYRTLGRAKATLGEGDYTRIRSGSASAREGCFHESSAAFDHQDQVPIWDGAEEPLRSSVPTPNTHTQDLSDVPPREPRLNP